MANGARVPILGEGSISFFNSNGRAFRITGVYYVPRMKNNLFSRRHAIKDGIDVRINMNGTKSSTSTVICLTNVSPMGIFII